MPVDQERYDLLIRRATFNAEFWRGTIQDLSAAQRAMSFVGAPTWSRINGWPCLAVNATGTTSAAVPQVVDVTGSFTVEALSSYRQLPAAWLEQYGATGGFRFSSPSGVNRSEIYLYDNAGVAARVIYTAVGATPLNRPFHLLLTSTLGGTVGYARINGIPSTVAYAGAGVAANVAVPTAIAHGDADTRRAAQSLIVRAYPFALTNEDCATLYQAAKTLVGGEI